MVTLQLETAVGLRNLLLSCSGAQNKLSAPSSRGSASPVEGQEFGELQADQLEQAGSIREFKAERSLGYRCKRRWVDTNPTICLWLRGPDRLSCKTLRWGHF